MSSDLLNAPKEFLNLFKAGKTAARQGDNTKAHALFRQAIEIDPYHEQVWLWLASVVETDEDRRVCFENVLELNSSNPTARRQLDLLDQKAVSQFMQTSRKRRWRKRLVGLLLVVILAAAAAGGALAFGIV